MAAIQKENKQVKPKHLDNTFLCALSMCRFVNDKSTHFI